MELWLIFSLIGAIATGLFAFIQKVAASRNYNSYEMLMYAFSTGCFISFFALFFDYSGLNLIFLVLILAFIKHIFYTTASVCKIESLRYIDASIFYPSYRVITLILILIIGFFFFSENISLKELIGIVIGISATLILINKNSLKGKKDKNYTKGIQFLIFGVIATTLLNIINKFIAIGDYNQLMYIFGGYLSGIIFTYFGYQKTKHKKYSNNGVKNLGIMCGTLMFIAIYFYLKALEIGSLGIVYLINSFSILIPVILSVIIYKEQLNTKKGLAIIFSLIAIILLK